MEVRRWYAKSFGSRFCTGITRRPWRSATRLTRRSRRWSCRRPRYLVPVTGKANIVLLETEYENFADYEKANEAFYSNPDVMKNLRRLAAVTVQGSSSTELYEDAPTIA